MTLALGQVIYEPGERVEYCYFPTSSIASLLYTLEDGSTAEVGLVGSEGVLGVALFLGGESSCSRTVVAVAGDALATVGSTAEAGVRASGAAATFAAALYAGIDHASFANRGLQPITFDGAAAVPLAIAVRRPRKAVRKLRMTQELIANMLGGRRESVTVAAGRLQHAGLIHYCRGRISILDRKGLESSACECYRVVEDEFDRLFSRKAHAKFGQARAALEEAG